MKRVLLVWLSLLWAQAAVAASLIVDGQYVAEAIARNAIVWDVRPADAYAKGHIAGAISIGDATKVLRDENTEDFIATERIEKILGTAGLDPKREIIVYGSRGTPNPYFGLYTLQYFGSKSVRVYHEGIEDWAAGQTWSTHREPRYPERIGAVGPKALQAGQCASLARSSLANARAATGLCRVDPASDLRSTFRYHSIG